MSDAVIKITGKSAEKASKLAIMLGVPKEAVIRKALVFFEKGVYTPISKSKEPIR